MKPGVPDPSAAASGPAGNRLELAAAPRTLPLRLAPRPGEALDSWLETLAHRLQVPMGELLTAVGLARRSGRNDRAAEVPPRWITMLHPEEIHALATATGAAPPDIHTMTLAAYDRRALIVDPATRQVVRNRLWGRATGSRFCPDCVAEHEGRWPLSWRLGWSFACTVHSRLLADACPKCARVQRITGHPLTVVPRPALCSGPAASRTGRQRCRFPLAQADSPRLAPGHPSLEVQRALSTAIESGTAAFGLYADDQQPVATALSDVRALAGRFLTDASREQLAALLPEDLLAAYDEALATPTSGIGRSQPTTRVGFWAPSSAAGAAVGLTAALHILGSRDVKEAGQALRPLIHPADRARIPSAETPARITTWGSGTSDVLRSIQLSALGPSLRPSNQLRYRTASARPAIPRPNPDAVQELAKSIPSMLWPAWSIRLSPPEHYPRVLRPAFSCALLLVGNQIELPGAAHLLGDAAHRLNTTRILQSLQQRPQWPDIQAALTALADHLSTHPAPIDYTRRRALDYTDVMPDHAWRQICRRSETGPGHSRRLRLVRSLLFEKLSGMPADLAPAHFAVSEHSWRTDAALFASQISPQLSAELAQAAEAFLSRSGIHNEPGAWQPPTKLLHRLQLPGHDPDGIDINVLHRLIGQPMSVSSAAEQLGVTVSTVRYLLEEQPPQPRPRSARQIQATGGTTRATRARLPATELTRLYLEEKQTIYSIAKRYEVADSVIVNLAHEYGIPLPPAAARTPGPVIDREWLWEQYVVRQRTLDDLARETGISKSHMRRWAQTHDIPLRAAGRPANSPGTPPTAHEITKEWLWENYAVRRRSLRDIGRETGMSKGSVRRWAEIHDIQLRPRGTS